MKDSWGRADGHIKNAVGLASISLSPFLSCLEEGGSNYQGLADAVALPSLLPFPGPLSPLR